MMTLLVAQDMYNKFMTLKIIVSTFLKDSALRKIYWLWLSILISTQIFIAGFLMVITFDLIVQCDNIMDIMKDFTALWILNEFDDLVGHFMMTFMQKCDSFCKFKGQHDIK